MNIIITALVVMTAVLSIGIQIVSLNAYAQSESPSQSERCFTQLQRHSAVGGDHGEQAERSLLFFCGRVE